ncbi:hypothetical protein SBF1_5490001 [Candidatus Desulfosporosinus infrequens]|uniref:Uncharacterized protein n=1 Tax=Candidatus Desulfosporosinus infrequens TaxID=2043169 RepID=A0A2U3LJD9_9FIRM|nr:hypothetical protein SBF1_5490001 [Candidatus Desulfosporosinus infrequens]
MRRYTWQFNNSHHIGQIGTSLHNLTLCQVLMLLRDFREWIWSVYYSIGKIVQIISDYVIIFINKG